MSKDLITHWVMNGVYFGYRPEDIISFVQRTSQGMFAPPNTILSGTGCISLAKGIDKESLIAEINQRRFCPSAFPDCGDADEVEFQIQVLLATDVNYREQVIQLLDKIGVLQYGTNSGNLQLSDS